MPSAWLLTLDVWEMHVIIRQVCAELSGKWWNGSSHIIRAGICNPMNSGEGTKLRWALKWVLLCLSSCWPGLAGESHNNGSEEPHRIINHLPTLAAQILMVKANPFGQFRGWQVAREDLPMVPARWPRQSLQRIKKNIIFNVSVTGIFNYWRWWIEKPS